MHSKGVNELHSAGVLFVSKMVCSDGIVFSPVVSAAMDSNEPSAFEAAARGDNVLDMDAPKSDDDW